MTGKSGAITPKIGGALTPEIDMNTDEQEIHTRLHAIYKKHQAKYKHNPDSKQMCCMWSTRNPPDMLCDTKPIRDIENAFGIELDEDDALELYDMTVDEAGKWIAASKSIATCS